MVKSYWMVFSAYVLWLLVAMMQMKQLSGGHICKQMNVMLQKYVHRC